MSTQKKGIGHKITFPLGVFLTIYGMDLPLTEGLEIPKNLYFELSLTTLSFIVISYFFSRVYNLSNSLPLSDKSISASNLIMSNTDFLAFLFIGLCLMIHIFKLLLVINSVEAYSPILKLCVFEGAGLIAFSGTIEKLYTAKKVLFDN